MISIIFAIIFESGELQEELVISILENTTAHGAQSQEIYSVGRSSIHEIYAGIYMLASVLCFGFGVLIGLTKENKVEK